MEHYELFIIGGGAAGISAARAAREAGCGSIALADRKSALGGVLLQCAHRGFGTGLTGPEYAAGLCHDFPEEIKLFLGTTVLSVGRDRTAHLSGGTRLSFSRLILATGCREIPMGALPIAGTRPRGIYTAGQMQEMMNLHGFRPQGPVVILGSGDIGLIMAGQIAALGICVTLVEQRETCGGLARNRHLLEDDSIPLLCGQTITQVWGEGLLEGCCLSSGQRLPCRTLLIAAGLRPERELAVHLGAPEWLTLCGNCRQVHPMVEAVVQEGRQAGLAAWETRKEERHAGFL